jgi:hypothetical protein
MDDNPPGITAQHLLILPGFEGKGPRGTGVPIAPVTATKSTLQNSPRIEDDVVDPKGNGMISTQF